MSLFFCCFGKAGADAGDFIPCQPFLFCCKKTQQSRISRIFFCGQSGRNGNRIVGGLGCMWEDDRVKGYLFAG